MINKILKITFGIIVAAYIAMFWLSIALGMDDLYAEEEYDEFY